MIQGFDFYDFLWHTNMQESEYPEKMQYSRLRGSPFDSSKTLVSAEMGFYFIPHYLGLEFPTLEARLTPAVASNSPRFQSSHAPENSFNPAPSALRLPSWRPRPLSRRCSLLHAPATGWSRRAVLRRRHRQPLQSLLGPVLTLQDTQVCIPRCYRGEMHACLQFTST